MNVDWNKYREHFPSRYFNHGHFDEYIKTFIAGNPHIKKVLDVGGGAFGTEVLKDFNLNVYLLDPFISSPPTWMKGQVGYDTEMTFDLIIARGSINYLTPEQILKLKSLLRADGVFLANTFKNPPSLQWEERQTPNKDGIMGTERFRLNEGKVEHEIIYPTYQINHSFYYYPVDFFTKNFNLPCKIAHHGKNSVILEFYNDIYHCPICSSTDQVLKKKENENHPFYVDFTLCLGCGEKWASSKQVFYNNEKLKPFVS